MCIRDSSERRCRQLTNRKAFYFFLVGTLVSLVIFLGLTWDTYRQIDVLTNTDKLDDQVVAGKRVFEGKNCNNCHTILGFGGYYAPDLTNVHKRLGPEGIKAAVLRPEEAEREIYSTKLAYIQLIALVATGVTALVGFAFGWTQGRPILEIPTPLDFVIVIGALIFLFNVGMTVLRGKKTPILGMLLGGLTFLALLYLFGMPFYRNLTIDWFYWWWVVHLWVEGAWELVTACILAFILIKITGVDRKIIEKYLYIETGLFLFTGLAGTGHHYYWIGAPDAWLWVGGIFSALEVVPIIAMVVDTFLHQRQMPGPVKDKVVWTFAIATAVGHLIGAGVFGFAHTLPQINYYTHGSQVTAAHGHLAFFGAYALLNLTMFWYALPRLRGVTHYNPNLARWGFWIMGISVLGLGIAMSVAGVLQTYIERVMGQGFMTAQAQMQFWFKVVLFFGVIVLLGVLVTAWHMLTAKQVDPATGVETNRPDSDGPDSGGVDRTVNSTTVRSI